MKSFCCDQENKVNEFILASYFCALHPQMNCFEFLVLQGQEVYPYLDSVGSQTLPGDKTEATHLAKGWSSLEGSSLHSSHGMIPSSEDSPSIRRLPFWFLNQLLLPGLLSTPEQLISPCSLLPSYVLLQFPHAHTSTCWFPIPVIDYPWLHRWNHCKSVYLGRQANCLWCLCNGVWASLKWECTVWPESWLLAGSPHSLPMLTKLISLRVHDMAVGCLCSQVYVPICLFCVRVTPVLFKAPSQPNWAMILGGFLPKILYVFQWS